MSTIPLKIEQLLPSPAYPHTELRARVDPAIRRSVVTLRLAHVKLFSFMRSLTLAAASTIPSAAATTISTLNDCTSPREAINYSASMTSNSGNNTPAVALTPSTHAQSHLDSVNASMAPTTQPNAGPNDSSTPMSTPILAQSASPDSKPTSIDKPDAGAIDRDDASVIAQEINAATPLQSDQCQGSPQDGLPSSSSATSVGPAQGKQSSITESVQQLADNNTASAPPNADSSLSSESNSKSTTTTLSNQSKGPVDINTSSSTSISATTQAVDPMQVDENSKKSEPEKKATGRVRYVTMSSLPFSFDLPTNIY